MNVAAGFTAPGAFLFELLARLGITDETVWPMLRLMESATTLLTDESATAGRRRVCASFAAVRGAKARGMQPVMRISKFRQQGVRAMPSHWCMQRVIASNRLSARQAMLPNSNYNTFLVC